MNFVDYLKKIEHKNKFEIFLLEKAQEKNLQTDIDFEKFFSDFSLDMVKNSADTMVASKFLYYSMCKKFWTVYCEYVKVKARHILAVEKNAWGE